MNFAAVVLAAGKATRFGGGKLSALFRGEPLVFHAIRAARAAPVGRVIVIAAPGLDIGEWSAPGPPVERLELASDALSASLQAGIAAAGAVDGVFVFLGDMPLVPRGIAGELAAITGTAYAALPRVCGKPGHPVLLSARACADAAHLSGDQGAGRLLRERADIAFLDGSDEAVLHDIDRAEDIARLE